MDIWFKNPWLKEDESGSQMELKPENQLDLGNPSMMLCSGDGNRKQKEQISGLLAEDEICFDFPIGGITKMIIIKSF